MKELRLDTKSLVLDIKISEIYTVNGENIDVLIEPIYIKKEKICCIQININHLLQSLINFRIFCYSLTKGMRGIKMKIVIENEKTKILSINRD